MFQTAIGYSDTIVGMNGLIYTMWLVFIGIGSFQAAASGRLRSGRGSKRYWTIPTWGRVLCLLVGSACTAAAIFVTARFFSK
jgi:hypothetical protein